MTIRYLHGKRVRSTTGTVVSDGHRFLTIRPDGSKVNVRIDRRRIVGITFSRKRGESRA